MAGRGQSLPGFLHQPTPLQLILPVKGQHRRTRQCLSSYSICEPPFHIGGACGRVIAQRIQSQHIAARCGAGLSGHGGADLSPAQPICRGVLIVNHQIKQHIRYLRQGRDEPCRQNIRRHRQPQPGRGRVAADAQCPRFKQGHVFGVFRQPLARRRACTGLAAQDQRGADPILKRLHPLRDGGGGDPERRRRRIKAAKPQDARQSGQLGAV